VIWPSSLMARSYLPVRPRPKCGESLSSWVVRTAHLNGLYLQTFCDLVWPLYPIWNRDTDRLGDSNILRQMAILTGTSPAKALATTFPFYEKLLLPETSGSGLQQEITVLGIFHRLHKKFGQTYCPQCLKEEGYYQLFWRLNCVTVCTKHRQRLLDRCWNCEAPVCLHRGEIHKCDKCGMDRRDAKTNFHIDSYAFRLQQRIDQAITTGTIFWDTPSDTPKALLRLISELMRCCTGQGHRAPELRNTVHKLMGGDYERLNMPGEKPNIGVLDCETRHQLMALVGRLIFNWPWSLIACGTNAKCWRSYFLRPIDDPCHELREGTALLNYDLNNPVY